MPNVQSSFIERARCSRNGINRLHGNNIITFFGHRELLSRAIGLVHTGPPLGLIRSSGLSLVAYQGGHYPPWRFKSNRDKSVALDALFDPRELAVR